MLNVSGIFRRHALFTMTQKRRLSAKAVYSAFPASLLYYSPRQKSSLFDHAKREHRPADIYDESVIVASSGLVYPAVKEGSVSNGAVMSPNTFTMQENIRRYFEEYLDSIDGGHEIEVPRILTVPKGTPIPSHLTLYHEYLDRFSLQPSQGMSLQDLNQALDEYFGKHAVVDTAENWINEHPYEDAMEEDAEQVWMKE